jgi:LuxR family maltose regulon positive regulatory protein
MGAARVESPPPRVPIVTSKFHPPAMPIGAIERRRLTERLAGPGRVTLVVAPPGYGKTVAVRQWLDRLLDDEGTSAGWLAVDLLDEGAPSFWHHFLRLLRSIAGELDDEPELLLLERGPDDVVFLAALVEQLERVDRRLVVVLDDLARVTDRRVLEGLALLVDRVGEQLHLVVVGRSDPALPFGRWRSAGWLIEVRQEQLRFTDDEARLVAASFPGLAITADSVIALQHRTEGWAVGLHLALLSISETADPNAAARQVAGSDRLLADYLVAELLDVLPPAELEVALALSVAEWFDPDVCRALVGNEAVAVARRLHHRRLFLTPIDEATEAMRFHSLFRELLESELRWRDPERRIELHRRAANHWRERGSVHRAHHHLTSIGDAEGARMLVMAPLFDLVDRGDLEGLESWTRSLPETLVVESAPLALDVALAWFFARDGARAGAWCDHAAGRISETDGDSRQRLHATRALLALMGADVSRATGHVADFVRGEPAGDSLTTSPIEAWFPVVAARAALATHRPQDAARWVAMADHIDGPPSVTDVSVPAMRAWLALERGELTEAMDQATSACRRAEEIGMHLHHGAFDALVVAGWCQVGVGDLEAAAHLAEAARAEAASLGYPWNHVRAELLWAQVARLRGDPRGSYAALQELRSRLGQDVTKPLSDDVDAAEALTWVNSGHNGVRALIDRLDDGPRRRLLMARAILAGSAGVDGDLAGLLAPRDTWPLPARVEAELLIDCDGGRSGDPQALAALVEQTAPTGWVSPFLGHSPRVAQLLRELPLERLHPTLARAVLHSSSTLPSASATELRESPLQLLEPLTPRELTILRLLPTHLSYADIGQRLYLSVNTVKSNLKAIYRKLAVGSRAEAVEAATALELL